MAEIASISYYPSHTRKWVVTGNFRSIGNVQVDFDIPAVFQEALIKLAQLNLDQKEAELRCELLAMEPQQ